MIALTRVVGEGRLSIGQVAELLDGLTELDITGRIQRIRGWTQQGIIQPVVAAGGTGKYRFYNQDHAVYCAVLNAVADLGIPIAAARWFAIDALTMTKFELVQWREGNAPENAWLDLSLKLRGKSFMGVRHGSELIKWPHGGRPMTTISIDLTLIFETVANNAANARPAQAAG